MLRGLFMSTKMKIIMENWRSNLNEQVEVQTVGQLVRLLNLAIQSKREKIALGTGTKEVVDTFLGLIPGLGAVKSVGDLLKKVYSMPDEKKTQTALDYLNVDDQISAIVDDRVENAFLKYMLDRFSKAATAAPNLPLSDFDMTKEINNFLDKTYHGRTVNTPEDR